MDSHDERNDIDLQLLGWPPFGGSKRGWSDWVCAARSQQPCQENCTTSAQTYFLKKFWSTKSVIVIPWLVGMCDDGVLQSFSLTSCVSAADVFIVCVDASVALVSVNFPDFFSGSDTGNTAGQMDPLLSVWKKAQLRIGALLKQAA